MRIEMLAGAEEAIEFALNELNSLGTEINDFSKKQSDLVTIVGYFDENPGNENLQTQISNALEIYALSSASVKNIEWRDIEDQDWLAEWKKHWRPTVTKRFIIAPTWETIEDTDKIIIRIEPSMAFGTGTHETTRLCLKAIEENYRGEMSFLDVGTGTGILAIAAAKFYDSKSQILGCDTDENSIKIAHENADLNCVSDRIDLYVGSISAKTPECDFVCANLTADVIVPLLPLLIQKTNQVLVLSGILREQEDLIVSELKKFKIEDFKIETDGEWISITVGSGGWQ